MATNPPLLDRTNINSLWGSLLVEECIRQQVDYFVLSPGSRSTPLTVAIARHPHAHTTVCLDERAAAFHALGYGRATGRPAVVVCTSGSAAANYFPAVIEASTDGVPLLILSADRPPELHHTGANQTIAQAHLYGSYVRWHVDLPCPSTDIAPAVVLTTLDQAIYRARRTPAGPVHLNWPFREPLAPTLAPTLAPIKPEYIAPLTRWQTGSQPYSHYGSSITMVAPETLDQLEAVLTTAQRGVIVVGQLTRQADRDGVVALAQRLQWPLLPDLQSGLRLGLRLDLGQDPTDGKMAIAPVISYFDQLWLTDPGRALTLDVVVQFGVRGLSKPWMEWLTQHPPHHHIVVAHTPERHDPGHTVSLRIESDIAVLCRQLLPRMPLQPCADWVKQLQSASQKVHRILDKTLAGPGLSEPSLARRLSLLLPPDHGLYIANSMPIRDMDRYGSTEGVAAAIGCDRGTSGIEGAIAAAAGFAVGRHGPVTLLVGDLSLLHDLNSLALLRTVPYPVVVIVINNNGGGIFSFLPIAQFDDVFEPYFETPHHLTFEAVQPFFDLAHSQPQTLPEFSEQYLAAVAAGQSAIIEVRTHRQENAQLHRQLQQEIVDSFGDRPLLTPPPDTSLS